jgi:hypothetical protein
MQTVQLLPLAKLHREVDLERALEYQSVIPQLMQTVHYLVVTKLWPFLPVILPLRLRVESSVRLIELYHDLISYL